MAAADATTDLRVGALVFDNDYRHPVVLAKEIATLDVLSGGRLELGLGAGWMRTDYEQSGIPYDPPGVRIDRMEEAHRRPQGPVRRRRRSRFEGEHYQITELDGLPKPVQRPHPPFLIGGGGEAGAVASPAREADIVGINPAICASGAVDADAGARRGAAEAPTRSWRGSEAAAGDRFDDIELNMLVLRRPSSPTTAQGTAEMMAPRSALEPERGRRAYPHAWSARSSRSATTSGAAGALGRLLLRRPGRTPSTPMAPVVAALAGT